MRQLNIALLTYSTKPRGGVTHTTNLAQALAGLNNNVHIYALSSGNDFSGEVTVPYTLIPCPEKKYESIDNKIKDYIEVYTDYLTRADLDYDILHAEDCISANALLNLREMGLIEFYLRTIHHIDDFTSDSLIECQEKSIAEPDWVISVSRLWENELRTKYSVYSTVINNGVDFETFNIVRGAETNEEAKDRFAVNGCKVMLSIGGIEPRKNTITALRAFNIARAYLKAKGEKLVWLIGGGETLFDYRAYREDFFAELDKLGLVRDKDIFVLGKIPGDEMPLLYNAADVFVFPSVKEGWGLVLLEAMAAGVPVISSNIEPMTEFLEDGVNSVLTSPDDYKALAHRIAEVLESCELRTRLIENGEKTARIYSWESAALKHAECYGKILTERNG
ncbi:MAG: MSMEG_0565 family glycosyltransferase [Thermodesulfobacteriota bacterium]